MGEHTELYYIVTGYTYLGIAFYYIIFDFISPVSDEISLIIIAYLSKTGLMNAWGGGVMAFVALYIRNIILFYLSRNRTRLISRLTEKYPVWMDNYQRQMSSKLIHTVFILTFIPKLRILVPVAAGFGRVKESRFFVVQAIGLALFILVYYPLGIFFSTGIRALINSVGEANQYVFVIFLLLIAAALSFFIGRYFMRRMK